MVATPSERLPDADFVVAGGDFQAGLGRARELGWFPVNVLARLISQCRVNLNVGRRPHASVYASSTSRIFEMASAGACIVSNPYEGIDRWFEPGRELLVVRDADEAVDTYRGLLADLAQAEALGRAARERVLDEHTYAHRARRLLDLVGMRIPAAA